ncbi:MAG: tetratricopeptide repeat protein [Fuerstia sp.]|nr:tetratricopeptide repeat protein [Fuerstiella sp.]
MRLHYSKTALHAPLYKCRFLAFVVLFAGCAEKTDAPFEFLAVARQKERQSKLPEAITAYKQALAIDEKNPTAWYDLGVAYAALEQFPEAIDAYSKAIDQDNGMAPAFNNRGAAYARLRQFKLAIADCDRAVALDPNDYLAWRNRGLARHDNGELDAALSDYDESIRINGRNAETYHYRGNVFLERKQWSRALEDFDQAIHLDDEMSAAWLSRAITLARLGRGEEAEEARNKAQALGGKVDDVVVADLLPEESAQRIEDDSQQQAVSFVRAALTNEQRSLELTDAPWDLVTKIGDAERKYMVRILDDKNPDSSIAFSANHLAQIQQQAIPTTLVIVREVPGAENATTSTFAIVKTLEDWTPDIAAMKPVILSLPFPVESAAADANPVVSAAPTPN